MSEVNTYPADASIAQASGLDQKKREELYQESVANPEEFWRKQGERLDWIKAPTQIKNTRFTPDDVSIEWYGDGQLNVAANCLDRHLAEHGNETAIIWEGDDPADSRHISYNELHAEVCKFSNALLAQGAKKGDVITLYMPMIPEAAVAMLACARIGAVHSVIFGGFSPDAIAGRVQGANSNIVITADEGLRGGKTIGLKANVDAGLANVDCVDTVIVVKRTGAPIHFEKGRDVWYRDIISNASAEHEPEVMNA